MRVSLRGFSQKSKCRRYFRSYFKWAGENLAGWQKKIISQTYDGASVMRGRIGGFYIKVKEVYENAYYVHCAAH